MPNGVPLTVEMNNKVYLRFISGDKTDLNNLFVPPGTQTFQVIAQNGGQPVDSNIVSSEFKAKKKKNFKIELQNQQSVPAGAAAPLSPGAKIIRLAFSAALLTGHSQSSNTIALSHAAGRGNLERRARLRN